MTSYKSWILEGKAPREVEWQEFVEWASRPFADTRLVGKVRVGEAEVSTVFLTVDHQYGDGPPILFESMIFGGPYDEHQWRYSTFAEAEAGHKRIVRALRAGREP